MSVEDQLRQFEAIMTCAFGVSYFPMSETRSYHLEQKAWIDSPYDSAYLNGAWNFYRTVFLNAFPEF
jgi:hypothetical protein